VFAETNADDLGQISRRTHLLTPAMRNATRDAVVLLAIAAALVGYHMYVDPEAGAKGAIDFRFHLVWLMPLVVVAFAPWMFHPYIVGGRDLPRRSRAPKPTAALTHLATQTPEWAAERRQGAA